MRFNLKFTLLLMVALTAVSCATTGQKNIEPYHIIFSSGFDENNELINSLDKTSFSENRVYIYVKWKLPKGKHNYLIKIYDGARQEVYKGSMEFYAKQDSWNTWTRYWFNPITDEPGMWWFEIFIDGKLYVEKAFPILGFDFDEDVQGALKIFHKASSLNREGSYDEAESFYNKAIAIIKQSDQKESRVMADCLHSLAYFYQSRGDYDMAIPLYKRALPMYENNLGSGAFAVARCLHNMGWSYYNLAEYKKAKLSYNRVLKIYDKIFGPDHLRTARCLTGLGDVYVAVGDYDRAESFYLRALEIRKKLSPEKDTWAISESLYDLAWLYQCRGEYARSVPLYRRAIAIRGPEKAAIVINSLASCYLADGKTDKACSLFKKTGLTLGIAACHYYSGEYDKAITHLKQSFQEKTHVVVGAEELAYIGLGLSYEALGEFAMARQSFKSAIEVIEAQWKALEASDRKNFLSATFGPGFTRLDAYEGMVRVIIKEKKSGYQKESLWYAETVKSRTFLEMLALKQAKGIGKYDREILTRDREFQKKIASNKRRFAKCKKANSGKIPMKCSEAKASLEEALQEYERFIDEVKLKDSELASLITVAVTPVSEIQSQLDSSFTLLEYFMTSDTTYVWLITQDSIKVHELQVGTEAVQVMVNRLLLSAFSDRLRGIKLSLVLAPAKWPTTRTGVQDKQKESFQVIAQKLYHLLFEPVEKDIHTTRLIIVPHGALHKVPFAALGTGSKYLIEKYAHSVVPSLTVVDYMLKKRNSNQNRFLAFANPDTDYSALRFAEKEVQAISKLFANKEIYLKSEATEGMAKKRADYADIVHFASHGEFNDMQPMQSGLILSKDTENDGYLQVHEIFGIDLKNSNLVILSACDTALSKIFSGDDLVGLSRAFIYAGTPTLLATLWSVDDRSTYIFMKDFYDYWHNKGYDKIEALRRAQNALKSRPEYSHPFYWAPFIIIGDWK